VITPGVELESIKYRQNLPLEDRDWHKSSQILLHAGS